MSSLVDAVAGLVELPVLAGRSITEWHDAVEEVFALRKERDRQNLEEAERALPHKLPMPSSSTSRPFVNSCEVASSSLDLTSVSLDEKMHRLTIKH